MQRAVVLVMPHSKRLDGLLSAISFFALVFAVRAIGPGLVLALPFPLAVIGVALTAGGIVVFASTLLSGQDPWPRATLCALGAIFVFVVLHALRGFSLSI